MEGLKTKSEEDKEKELLRLTEWLKKLLPQEYDKYDIRAKYDSTLTYAENKNAIREDLKVLMKTLKDQYDDAKAQAERIKQQQESLVEEKKREAESEVDEFNKSLSFEKNTEIESFYRPVYRIVEKMVNGYSYLAFIKGRGGLGKCIVLNKSSDFILSGDGRMLKIADKPTEVIVMNEKLKLEKAKVKDYFERNVVEVLELTTNTNRKITLTPEHPLYTINGWKEVKDILPGEFIATPRKYELNLTKEIEVCKVKLLAYLIAEGYLGKCITFTNKNHQIVSDFIESLKQFDDTLCAKEYREGQYKIIGKHQCKKGTHSLKSYIKECGLEQSRSGTKFIPNEIMELCNEQVALFLSVLWSCDGCIEKGGGITYTTKSEILARQIQHLLLRFGVVSKIYEKKKYATNTKNKVRREYYEVYILSNSKEAFAQNIHLIQKEKQKKLETTIEELRKIKSNENLDVVPKEIWKNIKIDNWAEVGRQLGFKRGKYASGSIKRENNSRRTLDKIYQITKNDELKRYAESDIFWDRVKEIKVLTSGFAVYDIEVDHPAHNFVANDIIVHNSFNIRKALTDSKMVGGKDYIEVTGEVTEAYLYRLIYENNDKIIWLKDLERLLRGIKSVNILKAACETEDNRLLTKNSYSKSQDDLPDRFLCRAKFIFDYNSLMGTVHKEDFEALVSRGDFTELAMTDDEIAHIMRQIAKTDDEKMVTEYLIANYKSTGMLRLNLRTQWKSLNTFRWAKDNGYDWQKEVGEEVKNLSKVRILLYSLIGNKAVRRTELKKLLLQQEIVSTLRTAERRIEEWLFCDELFPWDALERDGFVSINPKPTK